MDTVSGRHLPAEPAGGPSDPSHSSVSRPDGAHQAQEMRGHRQKVLDALGNGGRTFQVARRAGMTTPKARYYLNQLEMAGRVLREPLLSFDHDLYWVPTP